MTTGVSRSAFCSLGMALILSHSALVAQEGAGNVTPADSATPVVTPSTVPSPASTGVAPTSFSGKPMQAFGQKKSKSRKSSKKTSEELDVLRPIPSASATQKRGWFWKRKSKSADNTKKQSTQVRTVAAPTSTLPLPNAAATSTTPTSHSGRQMQAFGAKSNGRRGGGAAAEQFDVLPPMPGASAAEKEAWMAKRKSSQPKVEYVVGSQSTQPKSQPMVASQPPMPEPVYAPYDGPEVLPETWAGRPLQAFSRDSRHIQGEHVVSRGAKGEFGGSRWLRRAGDVQGEEPSGSKWSWENPFEKQRTSRGLQTVPVAGAEPSGKVKGPEGEGTAGPGVTDDTQLLASLKGVVIVPGTLDVKKAGRSGVTGLLTEGVVLPKKVQANFDEYLGKPLSLAVLDQMVRGAVVAFRSSDMPVVDVLVPEQEIKDGVLQLVVIKGKVGEVIVEGANYTDPNFLKKQISLKRGEILRESTLLADLQWMNKNLFRRVDMIYSPGHSYGSTDLILRTDDIRPFSVYAGVENSGNDLLGENRILAGFNWGGPLFFGPENTFSYQYVTDFEWDRIQGHSGVWTSYLPWRHHLTLLGAYVNQDVSTMAAGEIVDIGGRDTQGSIRYAIPIRGSGRWIHEAEIGFDYKSSNSNLAFGGLDVFDTTTEVLQFGLGYNIIESDRWGSTKIDTELIWSPGGLNSDNTTEVFRSQRGGAKANYAYSRTAIERNTYLPNNWGLIARVEGQLSSANLLASETLGAGGFDTIRGWEERIVRGDQGVVANLELRTPSLTLANLLGFHNAQDGMQLLTFFDYGYVSAVDSADGAPGSFSLGSVGVGLRYQLDDNFSLRLDYGYQVIEQNFDDGDDGRFHFGARANF